MTQETERLENALTCYDAVNGCVTSPGQMMIIVDAARKRLAAISVTDADKRRHTAFMEMIDEQHVDGLNGQDAVETLLPWFQRNYRTIRAALQSPEVTRKGDENTLTVAQCAAQFDVALKKWRAEMCGLIRECAVHPEYRDVWGSIALNKIADRLESMNAD